MSSSETALRGMHAAWALVDALVASGCDRFVVAPGSRSAPLTLAAARHPGAHVDVVLDERAAAFFALGSAKASGRPAAVITTSGTATANLLPAVIEAAQSCVPLVVLTADRPPELRGTGANQTVIQPGLYGTYVRRAVELGPPGADAAQWAAEGRAAATLASGRPAGPVHLNLSFDEPLTDPAFAAGEPSDPDPVVARPAHADVTPLIRALAGGARGVILAGTLERDAPAITRLASALGWPLIAEPTSGVRVPGEALSAGLALLGDEAFLAKQTPEIVLQIGGAPTSRPALRLAATAPTLLVLHEPGRPADPARRAHVTVGADIEEAAAALADAATHADPVWRAAWTRADGAARAALDATLDADEVPTELRLARDVGAATLGALFVGSSLPVRDLDLAMAPRDMRVLANRGASGIDGTVATTYGIAAALGGAVGLLGDLAVLHDASGFLWGAASSNATIVVPDNRGGGIFDLLPSAALPEHEAMFRTPHQVRFADLALAAGAHHIRVERARDLVDALAARPHLIEVPIDPARSLAQRHAVRTAVADALAAL
jgi:2-succinyl-5-enolpyruvyl-6-hydroxy-3-cyclohexene-1-carboxylate synthase